MVEERDDELPAIAQRGPLDDPDLESHAGLTEQPRFTLEAADERAQVASSDGAHDLFHEECLPRSGRCGAHEVQRSLLDEGPDEGEAADAPVDVSAELGVECDASLEQE